MGFDIECIIDIHTYPGEYFCPVCRTLVYPNEALQSQCTHLYCKPCLAHVANGTKACPYDGYLVTESDSKPLLETDKALAENVGKVKVHCLFFRSGCSWEGTLSDCTTHCSGCSFGNSPVICNRCGIQIVHRQVHEHAQTCPGGYEAQQGVGGVSGATGSSTASSTTTAEMNQAVTQSGAAPVQAPNSQNNAAAATLVPVQNSNHQINASANAQVPGAVPTPENWYQQQYQQYYQQFAGYESYQQAGHQYYPTQQPFQQYQQHPVAVQGQYQAQIHTPAPAQPQAQLQHHYPHFVPQNQQQPHPQPQAQGQPQPQAQVQVQGQAQQQPQLQLLPQAPPQAQAQVRAPFQASAPNYQVNPQQQTLPPIPSQAHNLPHTVPPPHGQPASYAQGMGMQPPAQRPHVPQYQQPLVQMHHQQASQTQIQPQMHPQPQPLPPPPPLTQNSNQSYGQPQQHPQQYNTQSHSRPPQPNQPTGPAAQSQVPHTQVPPVSGHLSYQQPLPAQQLQPGLSQQQLGHPHPTGGTSHPVQLHGQAPQQPVVMRPPNSFASLPQQQSTAVLPSQVPVHQHFPPHVQQSSHPFQQRPAVQQGQQAVPQQYAQQPFLVPFQGHLQAQIHFSHQQPMQPARPYGPPQPQPSQNYVGRPTMPHLGMPAQATGGAGPVPVSDAAHVSLSQPSINENNAEPTMLDQKSRQETGSPSKGLPENGSAVVSVQTESDGGQEKTADENASKEGLVKPFIKREADGLDGSVKLESGGRISEIGSQEAGFSKEKNNTLTDSGAIKQEDLVTGPSPNYGKEFGNTVSASSSEGHMQPSRAHGLHQQRPQAQIPGQPPAIAGPLGPGILSHPGQSFNPTDGRGSGYFGRPKSFESPSFPQGPPVADPHGNSGRAPQLRFEGQFGPQHSARPSGNAILKDQRPDEAGNFRQTYGNEPSFLGRNGGTALETSMFGLNDEKMKPFSGERVNPFLDPAQKLDQGSIGKMTHGPNHNPGSKFDPALGAHSRFMPPHRPPMVPGRMDDFGTGPGFGQHHLKHLAPRSPDRQYNGISPRGFGGPTNFPRGSSAFDDVNGKEASRFGEGSRDFKSWDHGNPFHDGGFPPLSGHPRRSDVDIPENLRFGEHMAPRPLHNYNRSYDGFVKDGPGHLMRGEFSGPGYLSGHFNAAETAAPGAFHGHSRTEEFGGPGNFSGTWNNHSMHAFPNAGGMDSYDPSRKRRPMSTGWCRICQVDCETVEGLDMHSQSREHQKTTMDMVKSIKQQNRKKQRSSAGHIPHDGGRTRKVGLDYRGNKP